jgi:hypothetical protein
MPDDRMISGDYLKSLGFVHRSVGADSGWERPMEGGYSVFVFDVNHHERKAPYAVLAQGGAHVRLPLGSIMGLRCRHILGLLQGLTGADVAAIKPVEEAFPQQ